MSLQSKLDSVIQTPVISGPAGASGLLIAANNGIFVNVSTINVAPQAKVPLTTNVTLNGTAINRVPGSTDILLAPNQTYYADI
ncbi:hypothetical protein [Bacillus cereus]|uniref:hypothetical protein n=1 Tax=Bacillus cereus TaxID=1396 RepID=UPI000BF4965F|nr:hypothetical protein [Bacillus cereus]PFI78853.1 hypothetical protein COI83_26950 [Bacillus cereus]